MDTSQRLIQLKASAGAGKTYALTERFLALLGGAADDDALPPACARSAGAACHGWPEIMAVTFTNKAAAEMKERVIGKLKDRALGLDRANADEWPRDKAALWLSRILRRYDQLNIRTIDSLLNLIMRLFALEANLAPDFDVVFDVTDVFDELFEAQVAAAEDHDGPERRLLTGALDTMLRLELRPGFLLGHTFRERLTDVLRHRVRETAPCETDPARIHDALAALHTRFAAATDHLAPMLAGLAVKQHFLTFLDKCKAHTPGRDIPKSTYANKASVAECLNKASQQAATPPLEAAYAALREAHAEYLRGQGLLGAARDTAAFIELADMLAEGLAGLRASRNVLLNEQCALLAEGLLNGEGGVPDAFCRLGARLQHMLVDEFQDTSRVQWQALSPLAEECLSKNGGVLFVGDVKQAIYGWRGGDARLFDEVPDQPGLTAMAAPSRQSLPYNWRSHRNVVEFNNAFFSRLEDPLGVRTVAAVMLSDAPESAVDDLAHALGAAFDGCAQQVPKTHADTTGYVRLTRIEPEDGNKAELMEAVRQEMQRLFTDLKARRAPGDVAVLVRGHKEAALVADWLLGWGLPVITENSLSLGAHPLVRQLVAFLRFLDYPLDDLSLWEFLSGEEIFLTRTGLTRTAVTDWLAGLERGSLYHRFRETWPALAERFLARYVKKAGFMTPYDTVSEAVQDFCVLTRHPGGAPFVRRFMEVVHAAEQAGHQSLAAFLEFWDSDGAAEKVPLPESVDAVRVMTIHQSKGLEFPVVVVPFHHWRFDPGDHLAAMDYQGLRLLAPLRREMGAVYYEHAANALLEQLDLLYVAWTRPEEELYCLLTATSRYRASSPLVRALDALTAHLDWTEDENGQPVHERGERPRQADPAGAKPQPHPEQAVQADECAPGAAPLPADDDPEPPMSWLPRLKIHRHFAKDVPREDLLGGGPAFDARARGTLMHDALDRLRRGASGLDPDRAARAAVAAHADALPPGDEAREVITAEIESILDWVLSLPDFPGWAGRGHPECPILTPEGLEKRPDLLVTDPDETVVVEYKTGQPSPDHERQVREYMALLTAMDGVSPNARAVILYLDLKTVKEVRP